MKLIKWLDIIQLIFTVVVGIAYQLYPLFIPDWLFITSWIVGGAGLIGFFVILFFEARSRKRQSETHGDKR